MKKNSNVNVIAAMILVILIAIVVSGCSNVRTIPWNESEIQQMKDTQQADQELSPVNEPEVSPFAIYRW